MKNIWKLFVGDVRRLTSNIVSIIIVTGLVVIPGLFSWFNISASWDHRQHRQSEIRRRQRR